MTAEPTPTATVTDDTDDVTTVECGNCGAAMPSLHGNNLFGDDDVLTCTACGTRNTIALEESYADDDSELASYEAYVSSWVCTHGRSDEDECAACDALDEPPTPTEP